MRAEKGKHQKNKVFQDFFSAFKKNVQNLFRFSQRSRQFWILISIIVILIFSSLTYFLYKNTLQKARAGSYSVTWTTLEDFEYNNVTTGTATLNSGVDLYAAPGYLAVEPTMQGTLRRLLIDAGDGMNGNWSTISGVTDILWPETEIKFRTRGSNDDINWPENWDGPSGIGNNDYFSLTGGNITTLPSRFLEIEITLISNTESSYVFLDSLTVNYNTLEPPTLLAQYSSLSPQTELTAGSWWNNSFYLDSQVSCLEDSPCHAVYEFKNSTQGFDENGTFAGNEVAAGTIATSVATVNNALTAPGNYIWRVKVLDNAGRSTNWVDYNDGLTALRNELIIPTGSLLIENGAKKTGAQDVHLSVSVQDEGGSGIHNTPVRFSNDSSNWSNWEVLTSYKIWDLGEGTGQKNVYLQIRDNVGNISLPISSSIYVDDVPPQAVFDANKKYPIEGWNIKENINSVEFRITTDKPTFVYVDYGVSEPNEEAGGSPIYLTNHDVIIRQLNANTSYKYRIRAMDELGNMATYPVNTDFNNEYYTFNTGKTDTGFEGDPLASNLSQVEITASTAKISWKTILPTSSWVDFGLEDTYGQTAGSHELATTHVVELKNLIAGKTYNYRVKGNDAIDNEYVSSNFTFLAVMKPVILTNKIDNITPTSAEISWTTNVRTTGTLSYGLNNSFTGVQKSEVPKTEHSVKITNLTDGTAYSYQLTVMDEYENVATSTVYPLLTPVDLTGPKIKNVRIDVLPLNQDDETAQVVVTWETDKPATSQVFYDLGTIGNKYNSSSIENTSLDTSHTVLLKNLNPATGYRFKIVSRDKRDIVSESSGYTAATPPSQKTVLQLIMKALEETFSWMGNIRGFWSNLLSGGNK